MISAQNDWRGSVAEPNYLFRRRYPSSKILGFYFSMVGTLWHSFSIKMSSFHDFFEKILI
jgi:hypothetical protein